VSDYNDEMDNIEMDEGEVRTIGVNLKEITNRLDSLDKAKNLIVESDRLVIERIEKIEDDILHNIRLDALDTSIIAVTGAMQILREMINHLVSELKRQGIEIR